MQPAVELFLECGVDRSMPVNPTQGCQTERGYLNAKMGLAFRPRATMPRMQV